MVKRDHFLSTQWMALLGHEAHCLLTAAVVFMASKHRRGNSKKDLFTLFSALCGLGHKNKLMCCCGVRVSASVANCLMGFVVVNMSAWNFTAIYWVTKNVIRTRSFQYTILLKTLTLIRLHITSRKRLKNQIRWNFFLSVSLIYPRLIDYQNVQKINVNEKIVWLKSRKQLIFLTVSRVFW